MSLISFSALAAFIAGSLLGVAKIRRKRSDKQLPLPPGPRELPFIGNMHQLNSKRPWLTCMEWKKTYGDIVYLRILGQDAIVLNSQQVADDLLKNRSSNYSDRQDITPVFDAYGLWLNTAALKRGKTWRAHRRILNQTLGSDAVTAYRPIQLRKAQELVGEFAREPEAWWDHIRRFSTSVILGVVYDHTPGSNAQDDPVLRTFATATEMMSKILSTQIVLLLSMFPFREYCLWLPGRRFNAARFRERVTQLFELPLKMLEDKLVTGQANHCVASHALLHFRNTDKVENFEDLIKGACGLAYLGEALNVIHSNRAISHNPDKYPSPFSFSPSRFLDVDGSLLNNEPDYVFGFGRRICPGRHLAKNSLWSAIVRILAAFHVEKAHDAAGNAIEPDPEWTDGVTT
ncbi:cytochrome P450 [Coniophora puteana RWD-64-598 SS2]|uniref:Cytochrome P450 n=1 Tax=Coniophora puteana (strain RWD-64-598) TaxID=741705 RepID=R7SG06_CONPW|nr:cytochrome P450 [Coniophora puteana RWD-64-598 SS2]EIW74019.1 cytochrome P450 [Coniophora puteana RWD-64-598 SS2]